jgi:uncharacterized RDD family membrane protein YckC
MDQPTAPRPGDAPPPPESPVAPPPGTAPVTPPSSTPIPPPVSSAPPYWQSDLGPAGPAPGVEFASYGSRIVAYIIDVIVLGLVTGILAFLAVLFGGGDTSNILSTILIGVVVIVSIGYFPFFWQRDGKTPGMQTFGIRVVRDRDGGPLGWGAAILRLIGFAIDSIIFGLPIGYLWAFVDKRRRCWHDLIASTVVVKG